MEVSVIPFQSYN